MSVTKIDCYCFTANVKNLIYIVSYTANAKFIVSGGKKRMNQSRRLVETMKNLLPVDELVTFSIFYEITNRCSYMQSILFHC